MMENNAPGRGKLKVTGIIYTVLGALSILGSLLILGAGGLLLASDNDVGLVLGAAAGVFSVLGAVSTCGRKAICNCRKVNGQFVFEGEQVAIDLENDVQYVSMCPQCYFRARRAFYAGRK